MWWGYLPGRISYSFVPALSGAAGKFEEYGA
jgi:hypothetical protein